MPRPPTSLRVTRLLALAILVGVAAWFGTWWFAGSSCPGHESFVHASSCDDLIASLARRLGSAAGLVAFVVGLLAEGLLRTAEAIEQVRREMARERREARRHGAG